jgi:3-hydroxybutyryl-CoA dehydrogenase
MSVRTWGIIGSGAMGRGIAELVASKGFEVILVGPTPQKLELAKQAIAAALQHQIEHWAITDSEKRVIMARISYTTDLTQLVNADFVLHAAVANLEDDKNLFRTLDQICRKEVVLASNTSTISITEIASATYRPDRVIGMHFVVPYAKTRVIEVVRGLKTTDETVTRVMSLTEELERKGIQVYESTGYVTTRLIVPLINEACAVLMEGVATAEDIDTAMRLGYEMARGPLETADRIGLDTVLVMCERLFHEYGDIRYRPSRQLKKLVRAGDLGVETGEGFFKYDTNSQRRI